MNAYLSSQIELAARSQEIVSEWLDLNDLRLEIRFRNRKLVSDPQGSYGCGYYSHRSRTIVVDPLACAKPSKGYAQKWSFPGYTSDRTPVGVTAHEFGHAIDFSSDMLSDAPEWRLAVRANRFSSYEPNACEAFAESFRLFLLNPLLFRAVCPQRFAFLINSGLKPLPDLVRKGGALRALKSWKASDNILAAASKKLQKAGVL